MWLIWANNRGCEHSIWKVILYRGSVTAYKLSHPPFPFHFPSLLDICWTELPPPPPPITRSPPIWWRPALHCTHSSRCILNVMLQLYLIVRPCGKLPCHRFHFSYSISFDVEALISDGCAECNLHEWSPSLAVVRGWPQCVLAPIPSALFSVCGRAERRFSGYRWLQCNEPSLEASSFGKSMSDTTLEFKGIVWHLVS